MGLGQGLVEYTIATPMERKLGHSQFSVYRTGPGSTRTGLGDTVATLGVLPILAIALGFFLLYGKKR